MYELHENEQYFFDSKTLDHLADRLRAYENPCCICAPLLGKRLTESGLKVTILDIDSRFDDLPGFRLYDLYDPTWLGEEFDIIVCDPPFFSVSLSQLFAAIRLLSRNDFAQPIAISYLKRRESAILGTFAKFGVEPSGYYPGYQTVQESEKNRIEFFTNCGFPSRERE